MNRTTTENGPTTGTPTTTPSGPTTSPNEVCGDKKIVCYYPNWTYYRQGILNIFFKLSFQKISTYLYLPTCVCVFYYRQRKIPD